MTINAEWHEAHPLPRKPTLTQRVAWHRVHAEHCGCREMPPAIRIEIDRLERTKTKPSRRRRR